MGTSAGLVMLGAATACLIGCSGSSGSDQPTKSEPRFVTIEVSGRGGTAKTIRTRIDAGASCAELFEARNVINPQSPDIPAINASLREIGCYSSSSTRKK